MGRIRDMNDEWLQHHERVDRVPGRWDPVERHLRALRLGSKVANVCVMLTFQGTTAAIAASIFSCPGGG